MAVYSIGFSEHLIDAARFIFKNNLGPVDLNDADRTVQYLSLLSLEITLKALLEKSGMPVTCIKKCSHNLDLLHTHICYCEFEEDNGNGKHYWTSAAAIGCTKIQISNGAETTSGKMLLGERQGASKYPDNIRYGEVISHFPPEALLLAAEAMLKWANNHWASIRISNRINQSPNNKLLHF
jgi:hypothetical protein